MRVAIAITHTPVSKVSLHTRKQSLLLWCLVGVKTGKTPKMKCHTRSRSEKRVSTFKS